MSDYKEYRPKTRISARVVERAMKVPMLAKRDRESGEQVITLLDVEVGDYETIGEDGLVEYFKKAEFESANEPVRRERQQKTAQTTGKGKGGSSSKNKQDKMPDKAAPAVASN